MVKMGKEVFTKVIHSNLGEIASGVTVKSTKEFTAPENMYIIGCLMGKTQNTSGGQCILTVSKGGMQHFIGSYLEGTEMESDDFVMFAWRNMADVMTELPNEASEWLMLPDGCYYFLEKGERLYVHNSTKNGHGSSAYYFAIDTVLLYTKTKP